MQFQLRLFLAAFLVLAAVAVYSQEEPVPSDTCVIELQLPDGARVTADGRDYATQRKLSFRPLATGKFYQSNLQIRFASGSEDKRQVLIEGGRRITISLADPQGGQPELMLQSGMPKGGVAWSRDGRFVLAGRILCDAATGRHLRSIPRPRAELVTAVALSPYGRYSALGAENDFSLVGDFDKVFIWELVSGQLARTVGAPGMGSKTLAYSGDGRYLAVGGNGSRLDAATKQYLYFGVVFLYEAATGRRVHSLNLPRGVSSLAFTPDSRYLLTGPAYRWQVGGKVSRAELQLWDVTTGAQVRTITGRAETVNCVDVSSDGQRVVAGSDDREIDIWDFATGKLQQSLAADDSSVELVLASADGRLAVTASVKLYESSSINLWNLVTRTLDRRLELTKESVRCIALSGDGGRLLVGTGDYDSATSKSRGKTHLWDVKSGRKLQSRSFDYQVETVALDSSGKTGCVFGDFAKQFLWDAENDRELKPLADAYYAAQFSPDGKQLVTGGLNEAHLWEVATGAKVQTFAKSKDAVRTVSFSPNGKSVLTAASGDAAPVQLWDVDSGKLVRSFTVQKGRVKQTCFSADGKKILAASGYPEPRALLWDAESGELLKSFHSEPNDEVVQSATLSGDGRWVLTGGDAQALVWDAATGQRVGLLAGHQILSKSVKFTKDCATVIASSRRFGNQSQSYCRAVQWDVASGKQLQCFPEVAGTGDSLAPSPDGRHVLLNDAAGTIFDVATGQPSLAPRRPTGRVHTATFPASGVLAQIEGGGDRPAQSFRNLSTGQVLSTLDAFHAEPVFARAMSIDGRYLVTGSWDKTAILWDAATGRTMHVLGHESKVNVVAISPNNALIATGAGDFKEQPQTTVWDAATGKELFRLDGHSDSVKIAIFSPNGRHLVTGSTRVVEIGKNPDQTSKYQSTVEVYLWDANTGRRLRKLPEAEVSSQNAAFTPDGRFLAVTGKVKTMVLYDVETGQKTREFDDPKTNAGQGIAFSPDGRLMATVATWASLSEPEVTVWDAGTGLVLRRLRGTHRLSVSSAEFSPAGRQLVTTSHDGSVVLWDVSSGKALAWTTCVNDGRDWITLTPEGFFDGSPEARQQVTVRVGGGLNVAPVDRFFQDFYRPGLLSELVAGRRPLPDTRIGAKMAPAIKIVSPAAGGIVQNARVELQVEVTDRGGGIRGPWLMQNGARVLAHTEGAKRGSALVHTIPVTLVEGANRIEIRAASEDGSWESEPAVVDLRYEQAGGNPELYLIAVGVNKYATETMNLKFAAADAQAMAELFRTRGPVLYGTDKVHVTELVDDQATAKSIREALQEVAKKAQPRDALILFLAGHGTTVGQRYYFIPHEFKKESERWEDDVRKHGLAGDDIGDALSAVPALKRVLIFDTCQSGGVIGVNQTSRNPFAFRGALERLSHAQGIFTLAATAATADAKEVPQLGHGVLTYSLLAALGNVKGGPLDGQALKPSGNNKDVVEVRDWFSFAQDKVPLLTKLYFGEEQFVGFSGQGMSFPVLPLKGE